MIGDPTKKDHKKAAMPPGAPQWMATFADLATLLLAFFVLLLSFSEMDVEKYKQVAGSMRDAFGVQRVEFATDAPKGTSFIQREFQTGPPQKTAIERLRQVTTDRQQQALVKMNSQLPVPIDSDSGQQGQRGRELSEAEKEARDRLRENLAKLRELLADEIAKGQVEVRGVGSRIIIRIRERGSFPSGSARLIEPFQAVLDKIAKALAVSTGDITIAGHTDNVPIENDEFRSNWDLSAARAVTLYHRLTDAADIAPKRVTVEGHADTRPLATNDTSEGRAENRRVEVILEHGSSPGLQRSAEAILSGEGGAGERQGPTP